jgi:8-oxo-dGTP diphosphatase
MAGESRPGVGVALLIRRGEQLLLVKRRGSHGAGTWSPPGGYLEFGERPEECAIREAREETAVDVGDLRFLGITNDIFPEGKHHVTLWFEAGYLSGEPRVAEREASEIGWFAWTDLPEPRFIPFEHLLAAESYPPFNGR